MRIALDNQCPQLCIDRLESKHHRVVMYARHESDEEWVEEALLRGAEVFISADLDIPNLLDRWGSNAIFIELPQGVKGSKLVNFIVSQVQKIKKKRRS